ncbi:MAG: hypothetical protein LBH19_14245 [Dysgonamonadaceae bacterium]|nr:hypothetical protein [Dysgonamonadaceae bacterium]
MKRLTILSAAILLSASYLFAERQSFRDRTETWLQHEDTEETNSDNLRIGSAPNAPSVPVGNGVYWLILLGGSYGVYAAKKYKF